MNLVKDFFSNIDEITTQIESTAVFRLPFDYSPSDLLSFAENELKRDTPDSLANSFGHTERALGAQLDYFLSTYGLKHITKSTKWGNKRKIELIGDLGLVPDRILHKVNEVRIELEHHYRFPTPTTAINSLDIVQMFVAATDLYLFPARVSIRYEIPDKTPKASLVERITAEPLHHLGVQLESEKSRFHLSGAVNGIEVNLEISADQQFDDFLYLLVFFLHFHRFEMPNASKFFQAIRLFNRTKQNGT